MVAKKTQKTAEAKIPTVIVYQNPDFVLGLLQETFNMGVLDFEETSLVTAESKAANTTGSADGQVTGSVNVPFLGQVGGNAGTDVARTSSNNSEVTSTDRKKFVYSQAYFLDQMRTALRSRQLIKKVTGLRTIENCDVGDFIEFDAYFGANEANVLLDILTPNLTAAITRYVRLHKGLKQINEHVEQAQGGDVNISVEKINAMKAIYEAEARDQAELASAIAAAVRQDFRGDTTKEFYARLGAEGDEITAITVCEGEYFVSKDSDRLLDGRFTVLAKVISDVRNEVPILERNKLLKRLNVEAVDSILRPLAENKDAAEYMDLEFQSTIDGASVTVLPIAIYV